MLALTIHDVIHPQAGVLLTYDSSFHGSVPPMIDLVEEEPMPLLAENTEGALNATCVICLEPVPLNPSCQPVEAKEVACITLTCSHSYCKECIKTYVAQKIENRQVEPNQLKCPTLECNHAFNSIDILQTTAEAMFLKYIRFLHLNELELTPHGRWCPNALCDNMVDCNPKKSTFQCKKCKTNGCYKCGNVSHPFQTCAQTTDKLYREWEAKQAAASSPVKPCPKCGYRIWKSEGCNHMTCTKCRHEWCWLCSLKWTGHNYHLCRVMVTLNSHYWGPCMPIRFLTKAIVFPIATVVGIVGGTIYIVGQAFAFVFYHLPKGCYDGYLHYQHMRRLQQSIVPPNSFTRQIQQGIHVFFHIDDAITPVNFSTLLPELTTGGRWRPNHATQYIQYVNDWVSESFVAYLSCHESSQVDDVPCAYTLIVLHQTTALPADQILQALVGNQTGQVYLVVEDESTYNLSGPSLEALHIVRTFQSRARILCVPNVNGRLDLEYLRAIYEELFRVESRRDGAA
ncbi:unnamed protein product [Aphanomyces euteiches]